MHIVTERFFSFLLFRLCIILPYDRIAALLLFDIFLGPSTTGACTYDERDDIYSSCTTRILFFLSCLQNHPFIARIGGIEKIKGAAFFAGACSRVR